ncbi:MAG: GTPase Era [Eubacteriales bacterium]
MKSGIITIVGSPNVGKSTLMNKIIGEKVAIVSNKPQTTRNRIYGILNQEDCQYVFLDTPGLHRAKTRLGDYMVKVVRESVVDVDAVVLMVNPTPTISLNTQDLIESMKRLSCPTILAINKLDMLEKKDVLLNVMDIYRQEHDFTAILPISARTGKGVDELLKTLKKFIPEGPLLFPEDMITDQPERQIMAEIIREKLLRNLEKEIPHGTAIEITKFSQRDDGIIDVEATIFCEKGSHKGIIIGKNGDMLKKISSEARKDMEHFMGEKVFLQNWVKVKENWRDNANYVRNFGYTE